jgi:hypothetical protein
MANLERRGRIRRGLFEGKNLGFSCKCCGQPRTIYSMMGRSKEIKHNSIQV